MEGKKWWASRTIWVNALTGVVGVLAALQNPEAGLDAQTVGAIGSVLAVVNIALRLVTDKAVTK